MKEAKKSILIICSWLDLEGTKGSFFLNQAEIFSNEYNISMLCFRKQNYKWVVQKKKLIYYESYLNKSGSITFHFVDYFYQEKLRNFSLEIFYLASKFLFMKFKRKGIKVDLIHIQSLFNGGFFGFELANFFNCKYLITEHNQISFRYVNAKLYKRVKEIFRCSSLNLVVSREKIKQFYANYLFFDFVPIGNMIDDSIFNYKSENKILERKKIQIVTVGGYHPIKGQDIFFKSLELIEKDKRYNYEIFWIGYNAWHDNSTEFINSYLSRFDLDGISIFLSPLMNPFELAKLFRESTIYVCPSISEGMSVAVLEALACGLPVVGTNCGGNDEIINKSNGVLVQVYDHYKLHNEISNILLRIDDFDRVQISKNIIAQYGKHSFFNSLNKYYSRLL